MALRIDGAVGWEGWASPGSKVSGDRPHILEAEQLEEDSVYLYRSKFRGETRQSVGDLLDFRYQRGRSPDDIWTKGLMPETSGC